jgi:hypothetical protein
MNLPPMTVARYGVYLATFASVMSIYLGYQAGATLDFCLLRAVFVFVVVAALGFGAEAVLTVGWMPTPTALSTADPEQTEPGDEP